MIFALTVDASGGVADLQERYAPSAAAEETEWPLRDVLQHLIEAGERLIGTLNPGSEGYEGYRHAIDAARRVHTAMFAVTATAPSHEAIERARAEGWRAGVESAAKFHLERAVFLAARVARLEESPETVPGDLVLSLVEEWRDGSAQDRQDAYALRSMLIPASMSEAVRRGEQGQRDRCDGLLKQMQERVELARANRDRSEEVIKDQAVEIQALRDEVLRLSSAKTDEIPAPAADDKADATPLLRYCWRFGISVSNPNRADGKCSECGAKWLDHRPVTDGICGSFVPCGPDHGHECDLAPSHTGPHQLLAGCSGSRVG